MDDKILYGVAGTALGSIGASISVTEIQAIISIIVTVIGFLISVVIPLVIKLCKKIKEAKKDGKITKEEAADIASTVKEIGDQTVSLIKEVSEKSEGEDK